MAAYERKGALDAHYVMVLNKEYAYAMPDGRLLQTTLTSPLSFLEQVANGHEVVGWNDLPLRNEFPKGVSDINRNDRHLSHNEMAMLYMILAQRNQKPTRKRRS
jgi:hypothetical protein